MEGLYICDEVMMIFWNWRHLSCLASGTGFVINSKLHVSYQGTDIRLCVWIKSIGASMYGNLCLITKFPHKCLVMRLDLCRSRS